MELFSFRHYLMPQALDMKRKMNSKLGLIIVAPPIADNRGFLHELFSNATAEITSITQRTLVCFKASSLIPGTLSFDC
jgi:hypothetical protein